MREEMNRALKEIVVPVLREMGFKGSYPHFRRVATGCIELLTFQFNKYGGSFVVEIGTCPLEGVFLGKELIPPSKINVFYAGVNNRYRLGSENIGTDYWFRFDKNFFDNNRFAKIAKEVLESLNKIDEWYGILRTRNQI